MRVHVLMAADAVGVTGITEPVERGKAKNRVLANTDLERSTERKEDPRRRP